MTRRIFALVLAILLSAGSAAAAPEDDGVRLRFEIRDAHGELINERTFLGAWYIVYFGFASCPDVCPVSLFKFQTVAEQLAQAGIPVKVLFVSVDPERDTPAILREYARAFGEHVHAATGDQAALDTMAQEFQIDYAIERDAGTGHYAVSHTSSARLIDPRGRFRSIIPHDAEPRDIVGFIQSRAAP